MSGNGEKMRWCPIMHEPRVLSLMKRPKGLMTENAHPDIDVPISQKALISGHMLTGMFLLSEYYTLLNL
jgi:hypothetical protein